jgi:hypothetical protein
MYRRGLDVLKNEEGSISILVIGLFMLLLSLSLILTDISSIYLSKRALNQTLEVAVQRALTILDQESYYTGEFNLNQLGATILGEGDDDPGVPIDCSEGERLADETLGDVASTKFAPETNIKDIRITSFQCDGFQIDLEATALVDLPMPIPFTKIYSYRIHTHAGGVAERASTNNYYGFDIG